MNEPSAAGVSTRIAGDVGIVEFANGPANYFTADLLDRIADAMGQAHADGARALVLSSPGKHFCAGADFSSIGPSVRERGDTARRTYAAGLRIFKQPLPVVAAVQGAAVGGGLGLACAADFRIVTPQTRLEANFTRLGFHPGFGLSVVLPHIIGPHSASLMLLESRPVRGNQAFEMGLADGLAERDVLIEAAVAFAEELASRAPLAVQAVRATLRRNLIRQVEDVLDWEEAEQRRLWATADAGIGMSAAKGRESPVFVGR